MHACILVGIANSHCFRTIGIINHIDIIVIIINNETTTFDRLLTIAPFVLAVAF